MVRCAFSAYGARNLRLSWIDSSIKTFWKITWKQVPWNWALYPNSSLSHDNDSKHSSNLVKEWLRYNVKTRLLHPTHSRVQSHWKLVESYWGKNSFSKRTSRKRFSWRNGRRFPLNNSKIGVLDEMAFAERNGSLMWTYEVLIWHIGFDKLWVWIVSCQNCSWLRIRIHRMYYMK